MAILREEYYIEYDDSKNEWELKTTYISMHYKMWTKLLSSKKLENCLPSERIMERMKTCGNFNKFKINITVSYEKSKGE